MKLMDNADKNTEKIIDALKNNEIIYLSKLNINTKSE